MSTFFRRTGVKIAVALLCVLSLFVACISGLLVLAMLSYGCYDGGGSLFDALAENKMSDDAWHIMQNYFDPNEPTKPWVSYYSGGIYTGENTNFLYNVTDDETGYSVLSTVEGGESIRLKRQFHYSFDVQTEQALNDRYRIDTTAFVCADVVYLYDEESDYFYPVWDERVSQYMSGAVIMPEEVMTYGFTFMDVYEETDQETAYTEVAPVEVAPIEYGAVHYEYDGEGFYASGENYEYSWSVKGYTITCYLLYSLPAQDMYRQLYDVSTLVYNGRFALIGIFAATLVLGIVLLCVLGCNLGRVKGKDEPVVSLIFRLPTDLGLCVLFVCGACGLTCTTIVYQASYFWYALVADAALLMLFTASCVYAVCFLAVRRKTHTLITGSILYWCVKNARNICRRIWGSCEKALRYMPLIWKVAVCYGVLCIIEFVVLIGFSYSFDGALGVLWFLEKVWLGFLVAYVALAFRRLKKGAEAIAAGDYTTKVSEDHLIMDFKDTADTLNHIQDGMNAAVESRMKSERLKTELITNVSHDIKTPLTSIVSYVDLLKKEPVASEDAKEYLEVLDRQSARLKKLVEDLVEASKASTGNITVHAEAMDLTVVLGQALGEYNERLLCANLTPVVKLPEEPAMVSADGRLLWRIFDNLLGNAVKYAMPGTRLYVSVTADTHAIVTIRNISREPLDVSADELMERFVRGDASRHTEGSGLGLSIAKSLAESMGGEFLLSVDGDLFKAAVIFPLLPGEMKESE